MSEADYVVVLDTGSTDGTYEKLLEYNNKDPKKYIPAASIRIMKINVITPLVSI